jgi:aspartate-semialdehyde dehydrogenase
VIFYRCLSLVGGRHAGIGGWVGKKLRLILKPNDLVFGAICMVFSSRSIGKYI